MIATSDGHFFTPTRPHSLLSFQNKTLSSFVFQGTQWWRGKINHPVHTLIVAGCRHATEVSLSLPSLPWLYHLHFTCSFHLFLTCPLLHSSLALWVWFTFFCLLCLVCIACTVLSLSLCVFNINLFLNRGPPQHSGFCCNYDILSTRITNLWNACVCIYLVTTRASLFFCAVPANWLDRERDGLERWPDLTVSVCVCVCVRCPLACLRELIITTLQRLMKSRAISPDTQTGTCTFTHTHMRTHRNVWKFCLRYFGPCSVEAVTCGVTKRLIESLLVWTSVPTYAAIVKVPLCMLG